MLLPVVTEGHGQVIRAIQYHANSCSAASCTMRSSSFSNGYKMATDGRASKSNGRSDSKSCKPITSKYSVVQLLLRIHRDVSNDLHHQHR